MFSTRKETEEGIKEWATWAAAAFFGVGVALTITFIFMPLGTRLILLGAAVGAIGWGLSYVVPFFLRYHTIMCPTCGTVNQVTYRAKEYQCSGCGRKLYGQGFWRQGVAGRKENGKVIAFTKKQANMRLHTPGPGGKMKDKNRPTARDSVR
ncbi:MAG: hypothetical protein ACYCX4_02945 [Bacillota bacterium]